MTPPPDHLSVGCAALATTSRERPSRDLVSIPEGVDATPRSFGERNWFVLVLGGIGVVAALVSLFATRRTPGFFPDSAIYVGTADNIRNGHGMTTPFNLIFNPYSPFEAVRLHYEVPL